MTRFWLRIDGDDLSDAMLLLNRAGIPTSTPFPAHYVSQPRDWRLERLTAAVDAETEKDARARLSAILPGYEFELRQADEV
jgi:hypothetical protein